MSNGAVVDGLTASTCRRPIRDAHDHRARLQPRDHAVAARTVAVLCVVAAAVTIVFALGRPPPPIIALPCRSRWWRRRPSSRGRPGSRAGCGRPNACSSGPAALHHDGGHRRPRHPEFRRQRRRGRSSSSSPRCTGPRSCGGRARCASAPRAIIGEITVVAIGLPTRAGVDRRGLPHRRTAHDGRAARSMPAFGRTRWSGNCSAKPRSTR